MNGIKTVWWFFSLSLVITTSQVESVQAIPVISHNAEITSVIIEGNTVVSDLQLEAVVADFIGQPITLENVQQLAKAISNSHFGKNRAYEFSLTKELHR